MNKFYLSILSFLLFSTLLAQEAVPHVYIKMNWKDSSHIAIQVGQYEYDKNYRLSIHPIKKGLNPSDTLEILKHLAPYIEQVLQDEKEILYYVHGFSADSKWYQKYTNSRLQKHVYNKEESPYGLVINLLWNSSPIYVKEKKRSFKKGQIFGRLINQINKQLNVPPSMLCHSMGNRVLGGIVSVTTDSATPYFNRVIMACPDIENNMINDDPNFRALEVKANQVNIYVHNNDRVLTLAGQTNKIDRLGHKGPLDWNRLPTNITILDASLIDDNEGFASQFSNHRYFFDSATGREDLMESLGFELPRKISKRKVLDRNFRYVIEPKS